MTASAALLPAFPAIARERARRFGVALSALFFALAGTVIAFDAWVDPFQQYRKPASHAPRFYRTLQRHINPGIAKNYDYDTVITGSSMMENYKNSEAGAILGGKVVNIAMGAATAYELRVLLETAIATEKTRHVIFDLNYNAFAGSPIAQVVSEPLPLYLYDDRRLNDIRYLLQWRTLAKSLAIASGFDDGRYSSDADKPWYWADSYAFSKAAVLRGLDLADINRDYRQAPRTLGGMMASFDANLLPLFRAHPEVRFSLVYPPYSVLVWRDFQQRGQVDVTLAFRRSVFQAVRALPNVSLYDFQTRRDWVTDLDHYKDIYHYSPEISRDMLISLMRGTDRVDEATLAPSEVVLRGFAAPSPRSSP